MSNLITDLENQLVTAQGHVTKLENAIDALRALDGGDSKPSKRTRAKRKPSPAGARKSIFHPNDTDVKVFDAILTFENPSEDNKLQMDWISKTTNIDKSDVQKSIKYLRSTNYITVHGKGRGTHYTPNVTTNDLQAVDPTTLGDNFRTAGGPTVREIVRTIFNSLEPLQQIAPAQVTEIAQSMFPNSKLTRQSFGQVFTKMASQDPPELFFEGDGRSRRYWRGTDKLEGAAEVPENFDFSQFFNTETTTTTETEETTTTSDDNEAVAS